MIETVVPAAPARLARGHQAIRVLRAVLVGISVASNAVAADFNLAGNGGFEQADPRDKTIPLGWTFSKQQDAMLPNGSPPAPETQVAIEWASHGFRGKRCVSIYTDNTSVFGVVRSAALTVQPNHKYKLRFQYKCAVAGRGPGGVCVMDEKRERLLDCYLRRESTVWTRFEAPLETRGAGKIVIEFLVYHRPKQTYCFDEVELVDITDAPLVRAPTNQEILTASRPTISWDAADNQVEFDVNLSPDREFRRGTIGLRHIRGRHVTIERSLADGTWFVRVVGRRADGAAHRSETTCFLVNTGHAGAGQSMDTTPAPPTPFVIPGQRVSFDQLQFLRVDGRPFYPIAVYAHDRGVPYPADTIARLRQTGFNTIWGGQFQVAVANHLRFVDTLLYTEPWEKLRGEYAKRLADPAYRASVLFSTADEPDVNNVTLESMRALQNALRSLDPHHPIVWIIAMPDNYRAYARFADALMEDVYPVDGESPTLPDCNAVGVAVEMAQRATRNRKPVFACIQAFDFRLDRGASVSSGDHRPTADAVCLMSYLAVIHGAKGIVLYAAGDPAGLDAACPVALRLRFLSDVLCQPDVKGAFVLAEERGFVQAIAKPGTNDTVYVIAANPTDAPALATFRFRRRIAAARVLFENRTITPRTNTVSDLFAPASTHLYEIHFPTARNSP